jgi:hypothetical protein
VPVTPLSFDLGVSTIQLSFEEAVPMPLLSFKEIPICLTYCSGANNTVDSCLNSIFCHMKQLIPGQFAAI